MDINNIGIIGQGFVGTAIREGFTHLIGNDINIETYDKFKKETSTCANIEELLPKCSIVFVCLPTPMKRSGSCDLSILSSVLEEVNNHADQQIVVVKSTVPPGTIENFQENYNNINVIFSPEFLTEANFINDFITQGRIILGGEKPICELVTPLFEKAFPEAEIIVTESKIAEMVKYFANCFLATKVSFANEMKKICANAAINYDKVVDYALLDTRIGTSHLKVPGPDGKWGFGGSCFPKDINALINFAYGLGVKPIVLESVWKRNLTVRPERDWERLKGRAVSE